MGASEDGPCKNVGGLYLALGEFEGKAPNFLDRPTDSSWVFEFRFFRRAVGLMLDGSHHGIGKHHQ